MKKMVTKKSAVMVLGLFTVLVFALLMFKPAFAQPSGASITFGANATAPADSAGSASAFAGNVTEVVLQGYTSTQSWQGYYGNVSGTVQLADGSDNVLYNWTLTSPEGEVYASTNSSLQWVNIQCFNYSADGTFTAESGNGGTVSQFGLNLSGLEARFNIASDDVDGVDETFSLFDATNGSGGGAGQHDLFYTSNNEFSEGECISTRVFGDTGAGVNDEFEEVLLWEPETGSVVFSSILEEADTLGFNDRNHDFEMLVLEDGHGTDTDLTVYYFFVEIE